MTLNFKVGTHPARRYHVCQLSKPPVVGAVFKIVDKEVHGSKPFQVTLEDVKMHTGAGAIYFVSLL